MTCPQKFPHRHNPDGTYDAICSRCYVTVARAETEKELSEFESLHTCDPVNLYRVSQGYAARPAIFF